MDPLKLKGLIKLNRDSRPGISRRPVGAADRVNPNHRCLGFNAGPHIFRAGQKNFQFQPLAGKIFFRNSGQKQRAAAGNVMELPSFAVIPPVLIFHCDNDFKFDGITIIGPLAGFLKRRRLRFLIRRLLEKFKKPLEGKLHGA